MFDRISKIALIILGVLFLILYTNNQNGRYQHIKVDAQDEKMQIFDTRTGLTYLLRSDKDQPLEWVIIDPVKGTVRYKKADEK